MFLERACLRCPPPAICRQDRPHPATAAKSGLMRLGCLLQQQSNTNNLLRDQRVSNKRRMSCYAGRWSGVPQMVRTGKLLSFKGWSSVDVLLFVCLVSWFVLSLRVLHSDFNSTAFYKLNVESSWVQVGLKYLQNNTKLEDWCLTSATWTCQQSTIFPIFKLGVPCWPVVKP